MGQEFSVYLYFYYNYILHYWLTGSKQSSDPPVTQNWDRLVGQVLFGAFYRGLIHCAIPWEGSFIRFVAFVIPLGTAFGVHMVGNVGRQKSLVPITPLIGAYISG